MSSNGEERDERELLQEVEEQKKPRGLLTRRQALMVGAAAGAGLMLPWKSMPQAQAQERSLRYSQSFFDALQVSPRLTKFADPLTFPPTAVPSPADPLNDRYAFDLVQFQKKLHSQLPATTLFGYGGEYPGPTIVATRGKKVFLTVRNRLFKGYPIPVDTTIGGVTNFVKNNPPFCVHLHGGEVPPEMDGNPMDRFAPGGAFTYEYPNLQEGATIWYHDHALGVTRLNVIMGMAGFYPIVDPVIEPTLGLPSGLGQFDIPLAIQDRVFNPDGSFFYPPQWQPEYFGDTALVNGVVWPFFNVVRGWYRLRLLNGSNARFYRLTFDTPPPAAAGPIMWYIASDGGYLPRAFPVPNSGVLIAPGERMEVVVNFGAYNAGTRVRLINNAPAPFPTHVPGTPRLPVIMQFRVQAGTGPTFDPTTFRPTGLKPPLDPAQAVRNRYLTLVEKFAPGGAVLKVLINNNEFFDPVTEDPKAGDIEIWNIINDTADAHPIHTHQVMFNVLSRQKFDAAGYRAANPTMRAGVPVEPFLLGTPTVPRREETGYKDTVKAWPGEVTRIIMQWGPFKGNYVYHCHILDHEDNEMMRPVIVS